MIPIAIKALNVPPARFCRFEDTQLVIAEVSIFELMLKPISVSTSFNYTRQLHCYLMVYIMFFIQDSDYAPKSNLTWNGDRLNYVPEDNVSFF